MATGSFANAESIRHTGTRRARCCEAGATRASVARELGLSEMTVHRWARNSTSAASAPIRIVEVIVDDKPSRTTRIVVTTPRGLRIEGLDVDSVAALIARLG